MTAFTAPARKRRRPSLTPMIDVVFLLLVFFMLASRFGIDRVLPLPAPAPGTLAGAPRLVDVLPDGLRLNGIARDPETLVAQLRVLLDDPSQTIVLRGGPDTDAQRIVDVASLLRQAGFPSVVLAE